MPKWGANNREPLFQPVCQLPIGLGGQDIQYSVSGEARQCWSIVESPTIVAQWHDWQSLSLSSVQFVRERSRPHHSAVHWWIIQKFNSARTSREAHNVAGQCDDFAWDKKPGKCDPLLKPRSQDVHRSIVGSAQSPRQNECVGDYYRIEAEVHLQKTKRVFADQHEQREAHLFLDWRLSWPRIDKKR